MDRARVRKRDAEIMGIKKNKKSHLPNIPTSPFLTRFESGICAAANQYNECMKISGFTFLIIALLVASTSALNLPKAPNCPIFPATNVWNKSVKDLPVHRNSAALIRSIGSNAELHPDFGSNLTYGIPYNVVGSGLRGVKVDFYYPDESDPGPYPIPAKPKREKGSDRHILIVDKDSCTLYELYDA